MFTNHTYGEVLNDVRAAGFNHVGALVRRRAAGSWECSFALSADTCGVLECVLAVPLQRATCQLGGRSILSQP